MTDLDRNLAELWGDLASHSEYRRGDQVRYTVGLATYTGSIIWIAAAGPSMIEGHPDQPLKYVIEREGWTGFPDIAISSDIEGLSGGQEPVLVRCPYCLAYHSEQHIDRCPLRPL